MACSAARLRAAAYRSAGERSSVIVLSSLPATSDNGAIIIRIVQDPDRAAHGRARRRRTQVAPPTPSCRVGSRCAASGDVVVAVDAGAARRSPARAARGCGDGLDLADGLGRQVQVGGLVVVQPASGSSRRALRRSLRRETPTAHEVQHARSARPARTWRAGRCVGVATAAKTVMPMIMPRHQPSIRVPVRMPVKFSMTSSSGSSKASPKTTHHPGDQVEEVVQREEVVDAARA